MMAQALRVEIRMSVPEETRLRMESLKNKLNMPGLDALLLGSISTLDHLVMIERRGGKIILEDADGNKTQLRILDSLDPTRGVDRKQASGSTDQASGDGSKTD